MAVVQFSVLSAMDLSSLMLYLCVALISFIFVKNRYLSSISDIPGPFLAYFGTCFQVLQVFKGRSAETILRLHQRHGPFVRLSPNEVSIDHPDAPRTILAADLVKGSFYKPFMIPNSNYPNLMGVLDPQAHSAMRMNVAPAYTMANVLRNEAYIDKTIALMEERVDSLSQSKRPIDFALWIQFLTWDIMGEITFSSRFGFLDQARDVGNAISNTFYLGFYVTTVAYMQWLHALLLGNPFLRWMNIHPGNHAYVTCVKSIAARKGHTEPHVDMMEHWLKMQAKFPERMTDKDVFSAVMGNLGGGGDTIGSVLQAFFYLMLKGEARHRQTLQDEIDAANARGELSHVVSYAEAQKLPFLQACIKETLRFFPALGWNLPRVVPPGGLTVAGRRFEQGTLLSVNPYVIHRNPKCFGPDAEVFNPERWLDPVKSVELERYLIPFGLGYNACPGRNVARIELSKITATVMRDFDLQLAHPDKDWVYHRTIIAPSSHWDCYVNRRKT